MCLRDFRSLNALEPLGGVARSDGMFSVASFLPKQKNMRYSVGWHSNPETSMKKRFVDCRSDKQMKTCWKKIHQTWGVNGMSYAGIHHLHGVVLPIQHFLYSTIWWNTLWVHGNHDIDGESVRRRRYINYMSGPIFHTLPRLMNYAENMYNLGQ